MRGNEIKAKQIEKGIIKECTIKKHKDGKSISKVNLVYGGVYKVVPDNPNKLKHRDREGILMGFKLDDLGNPMSARIKFDDTGRVGYVDVEDLIPFKNEL